MASSTLVDMGGIRGEERLSIISFLIVFAMSHITLLVCKSSRLEMHDVKRKFPSPREIMRVTTTL
jgi:hypothetical protein